MRIVLLGPPGSGKGTQAEIVARELDIPAISSGEIFRDAVGRGTPLGEQAAAYTGAGDLVPDEITVALVAERLQLPDARGGYLLDGFPRTIAQAQRLDASLAARGQRLDLVLELAVDEEEVVRRLAARRVLVDGSWAVRDDDRPETVRHRLEVYREVTAPLAQHYARAGLLSRVDATGEVEVVAERVLAALRGAPGSGVPVADSEAQA
jgi:adenylate kinase